MKEINREIVSVEKKDLVSGGTVYVGFTALSARAFEGMLFGMVVTSTASAMTATIFIFISSLIRTDNSSPLSPSRSPITTMKIWTQKDVAKLQGRLQGKDLFTSIPFDPEVDAVSQATMSSYLIFEGINETKAALGDYKENGFRGWP